MPTDVKIPEIGESVTEAYIEKWVKSEGDAVEKDETIAELESEKAGFELPAPASGTLVEILVQEGDAAEVGDVVARIETGEGGEQEDEAADQGEDDASEETKEQEKEKEEEKKSADSEEEAAEATGGEDQEPEAAEKEDGAGEEAAPSEEEKQEEADEDGEPSEKEAGPSTAGGEGREEERVKMSPMRRTIAKHLVAAQREAALLTTFNEIDMTAVKRMRAELGETFRERHGVKLGFMSFFVRAAVDALRQFPKLNARVDGEDLVYRNYCDIGIAVSSEKGLLVPVLRDADRMSFGEIEKGIDDFADRAAVGDLELDELRGGTFTITNGGVFGSLLSTPIVNPPQAGVLGMHAIEDRPVAVEGEVVVRPMMYVALTYDHRVVDGKEAVQFLGRVKETVQEPSRLLVEA